MSKSSKLLYENAANWQYATGVPIADPALWYQTPSGKTHIIVSELEIALMRATAKVDNIHAFADIKKHLGEKPNSLSAMIGWLKELEATDTIEVPADFPAALCDKLKAAGLPLAPSAAELFFPARAVKSLDEVEKLAAAQRANEQCFHRAWQILREAEIARDRALVWKGSPLTSETMQREMNKTAIDNGALEFHNGPIVAGGAQGAMPHERGHGQLFADTLIVIDCFPRHANGYWGDCTRTALKGKPTQWQRDIYAAVLAAQEEALSLIKAGAAGKDIHNAVAESLSRSGFPTGTADDGTPYGFFHGTGHGVGLELHDPGPRMLSTHGGPLESGHVTSVEPGLYYPPGTHADGVGGVRIEDVVVVMDGACHNLNSFPKDKWVID